jgi:hypothetical protein
LPDFLSWPTLLIDILAMLVVRVILATSPQSLSIATFSHHVIYIVLGGASKEMRWICTVRVVATVANEHPIGNGAIEQLIGKAMGGVLLSPEDNASVSWGSDGARIPAFVTRCNGDLLLESFSQ